MKKEKRHKKKKIERIVYYYKDEHLLITNAPQYRKELDQLLKILRKTGIRKVIIY